MKLIKTISIATCALSINVAADLGGYNENDYIASTSSLYSRYSGGGGGGGGGGGSSYIPSSPVASTVSRASYSASRGAVVSALTGAVSSTSTPTALVKAINGRDAAQVAKLMKYPTLVQPAEFLEGCSAALRANNKSMFGELAKWYSLRSNKPLGDAMMLAVKENSDDFLKALLLNDRVEQEHIVDAYIAAVETNKISVREFLLSSEVFTESGRTLLLQKAYETLPSYELTALIGKLIEAEKIKHRGTPYSLSSARNMSWLQDALISLAKKAVKKKNTILLDDLVDALENASFDKDEACETILLEAIKRNDFGTFKLFLGSPRISEGVKRSIMERLVSRGAFKPVLIETINAMERPKAAVFSAVKDCIYQMRLADSDEKYQRFLTGSLHLVGRYFVTSEALDNEALTLLFDYAMSERVNGVIKELLTQLEIRPHEMEALFLRALDQGKLRVARAVYHEGKMSEQRGVENFLSKLIVKFAARNNRELVHFLREFGVNLTDAQDEDGNTAMHYAAFNKDHVLAKFIAANSGTNIMRLKNKEGKTPEDVWPTIGEGLFQKIKSSGIFDINWYGPSGNC